MGETKNSWATYPMRQKSMKRRLDGRLNEHVLVKNVFYFIKQLIKMLMRLKRKIHSKKKQNPTGKSTVIRSGELSCILLSHPFTTRLCRMVVMMISREGGGGHLLPLPEQKKMECKWHLASCFYKNISRVKLYTKEKASGLDTMRVWLF